MPSEINDLSSQLALSGDARHRAVGEEGVVVMQKAGEVIVVNGIGSRILELMDGETTTAELIARLESEYEVDQQTLAADIKDYVAGLVEAGAVQLVAN